MKVNIPILLIFFSVVAAVVYYIENLAIRQEVTPSVFRVGVLPDENVEVLHQRYMPLLNYLSEKTSIEYKLVIPASYSDLVQQFRNDQLDMAYFGGFTFIQAYEFFGAQALVMRELDTQFTSLFLVRYDNQADELADFKDKTFSFGNKLSTSGHLMPRHFMKVEKQIIPEKYFAEVQYSGAHDKTVYLICDGVVDLGVVNSEIFKSMLHDGRLQNCNVRVLWETPPYPDYVWSVHESLNAGVKTKIRDAFLDLDINNESHREILQAMGARSFLPVNNRKFLPLKTVAESLDMLEIEDD
jgi:phosphonate transport system substrate-binding protein